MKRKNVDRDLVDSVMDWVTSKGVSLETVEVVHQRIGTRLKQLSKREQNKLMRKMKPGTRVEFIDRSGELRIGEILGKDRKIAVVIVRVDGEKKVMRVSPSFLKLKKGK